MKYGVTAGFYMAQLREIKLDWKNMKCMQIFKKKGGGE